jgi:hypothetical protein
MSEEKDVIIESWDHLQSVLYNIPIDYHNRYRSNYVYRGQACKNWKLETSLKRLGGDYDKVEKPLLRNFCKYARPGDIPGDSIWIKLSVAQHHGLPTRLLDWTVSPKIALHFTTSEVDFYNEDGVIWCVDVVKVRDLLPVQLKSILKKEYAFLFSIEMLNEVKALSDFDTLPRDDDFVLFFEPPSLDARIVNQAAIMSVMPSPNLTLCDLLKKNQNLYFKIIIPAKLKWEIRDKLDQDNTTERMLFPGLDGTARWLRRYYSPKL